MPWKQLPPLHLKSDNPPSFLANNLAADNNGRLSFTTGTQVRCTKRIFNSPAHPDYTLAYSEKLQVTNTYWWSGIPRYTRPLLLLTTAGTCTSAATVQIWNTSRSTGTRIFRAGLPTLNATAHSTEACQTTHQVQFARGIAQVSHGRYGSPVYCGGSNGRLYGIYFKGGCQGGFQATGCIEGLRYATTGVAGDKQGGDLLAAGDESGRMVVWSVRSVVGTGGGEGGGVFESRVVYEFGGTDDMVMGLGVRGGRVYAGHASGLLTVHDVTGGGGVVGSVVTNSKAVMAVDVYVDKELVLVCGEDCRVTVVGFSAVRQFKPVVHFSVALECIIVGCAFVQAPSGYPRIVLLCWEACRLLQYDYEKCRDGKQARGGEGREARGAVQVVRGAANSGRGDGTADGEWLVGRGGGALQLRG